MPIQVVNVENSVKAQVMFDNCSQNSFILEDFAKQLKLNGTPISFILVTTDGKRTQKSGNLYQIRLKDKENNVHQIDVIGIDQISSKFPGFTVRNISKKLSKSDGLETLTDTKLNRKSGSLDLLIGSDLPSLHPVKVGQVGELSILKSIFGTGFTVMGRVATLSSSTPTMNCEQLLSTAMSNSDHV